MLFNADCFDVFPKIPEGSVDLVLTDLPYGTTSCKWDAVIPFEPMWAELSRVCKPNSVMLFFGAEPFSSALRMSNIKQFKYDWVWSKPKGTGFLNAKKQPMRCHEFIHVFYGKSDRYYPQMTTGHALKRSVRGNKNQTDVYRAMQGNVYESDVRYPRSVQEFHSDTQNTSFHPTQKPVALLEYLIKTYAQEGETVLDFTMGSGSTGVAAINTKRKFIGIEKDLTYYNIAANRIYETMICS